MKTYIHRRSSISASAEILDEPYSEGMQLVEVLADNNLLFRIPQGRPFRFEDFTPEQLASLKGTKGDTGDMADNFAEMPDSVFDSIIAEGGE